jgi:hypothetical protein
MSSSFGTGTMAISPITLMYQWHAHSSPFISSTTVDIACYRCIAYP